MSDYFPMGHGIAGVFGGLPAELSREESSKVVILPCPFDQTTTYRKGADLGPAAMVEASRNMELYDIETDSEPFKQGIYTAKAIIETDSEIMLERLYKDTLKFLKKGKFVVTLGGEHSISSAPIRAHAEQFGKISVLQLDAHLDLYDAYEGNPYSHASVMMRVREIPSVDRIVAVGIRSMGIDEKNNLDKEATFFAHEIYKDERWMDEVINLLSPNVYLSFDLDAFDSSIMPSTGTPEPGGLSWYPILKLLKRVAIERTLVGCDVVELCPNLHTHAPDFLAAKVIYKILAYKFCT